MKPVRIYFAGSYETKPLIDWMAETVVARVQQTLVASRFSEQPEKVVSVVSTWHRTPALEGPDAAAQRVNVDFSDLAMANVVVSSYPYGYGTSAELGFAVARGIPIIYLVDPVYLDDLPFAANVKPGCIVVHRVSQVARALLAAINLKLDAPPAFPGESDVPITG